ncbi:hypothetical protein CPLU01_01685 [Colletotrichum plurivorum]|uniref:Uncharacterized protein n=1 Tax=Colletotrichum plurivorum TaxID=2175906 RepID=A0A8H6KYD6_9PEZI|nr:hypothetical protein CPLU01_01685 [Colletotrichum plurivorum]
MGFLVVEGSSQARLRTPAASPCTGRQQHTALAQQGGANYHDMSLLYLPLWPPSLFSKGLMLLNQSVRPALEREDGTHAAPDIDLGGEVGASLELRLVLQWPPDLFDVRMLLWFHPAVPMQHGRSRLPCQPAAQSRIVSLR